MDASVKPCDDFYNFACGSFIKSTKIPDEKTEVDAMSSIEDKLQEQLKSLLSDTGNASEIEPFKLAKNLYKACMNKSIFD